MKETKEDLQKVIKDLHSINTRLGRDRDYWKDAHQIIKEDKNHDAWMHDKDVIKLQAQIIILLRGKS